MVFLTAGCRPKIKLTDNVIVKKPKPVVEEQAYFKSEPQQFYNQGNPYQWHNTFKFIENTLYKQKRTYSDYEIQERLERNKK